MRSAGRARAAWLVLACWTLILPACDRRLAAGSMVSALTADGRVLVGQLRCEGTTMPARDEAFIWQRTGDPGHPLEKLWEGRLASPASALPSSGVDLFATYRYVDGPLGNVTSLDGLGDDVSISVVLQFSGASGFTLGAARQAPTSSMAGRQASPNSRSGTAAAGRVGDG